MRRCKLGMRKGYQLTIKGYEWSIGGIGVRPEGGASAYKILLSAPRFPVRYDDHNFFFGGGGGVGGKWFEPVSRSANKQVLHKPHFQASSSS